MNWSNVKLILGREIRDQLRDRRTLFMIVVVPILLYPLLGMSFFQVTQFLREHPIRVLVAGAPENADLPPLVDGERFAGALFDDPRTAQLLRVTVSSSRPALEKGDEAAKARVRQEMVEGNYDVVVEFSPDFSQRFAQLRQALARGNLDQPAGPSAGSVAALPEVEVYPNLAKDASRAAHRRVVDVLDRWREAIARRNLAESHVPMAAAKPFLIATVDVAEEGQHKAAAWSKILPFVLLIWALTGAFYPAIDLCAGEKERGTLETLLSSPAERIEIVWGKLLTVMLFSVATAVLNLASLGLTGSLILSQLPLLGPPPTLAIVWLLLALVPMAALFSALCLALAAFARSTKEGQYYLMPLVLITLPLVLLPMAPGVQLNLGNSLIPITGVVLLLRAMLEGTYLPALPYVPLVLAVTLGCCWLAIRWATNQFNSESVLFRESERLDPSLWLKHLMRDREATPSFAEAMACGVLILMLRFFLGFALGGSPGGDNLLTLAAATQLVVVLTPAVLMTVMLTRSPMQTLLLRRPSLGTTLGAGILAAMFYPTFNLLHTWVLRLYPISEGVTEHLAGLESGLTSNLPLALFVLALLPAVCEELAFRGFILSGFRRLGHKWTAIIGTSIFFALTHAVFQQSLLSCLLGVVLGFIAVQTGSLLPAIAFHFVHNSLGLLIKPASEAMADENHWLHWLLRDASGEGQLFHWPVIAASLVGSLLILFWLHKLPYIRTPEENLQQAIDHRTANWLPS